MEQVEFGNIVFTQTKITQHNGTTIKYIPTRDLDGAEIVYLAKYQLLLFAALSIGVMVAADAYYAFCSIVAIGCIVAFFLTRKLNLVLRSGDIKMGAEITGKDIKHAEEFILKIDELMNQRIYQKAA